jgi:hypothetical protein
MRTRYLNFLILLCCAVLLSFSVAVGAEKVVFEPVRAPFVGPENAKVVVYEIADFM